VGVSGNTTLDGTLDVSGATTLDSTLNVSGAATFQSDVGVSGNTTLDGTLDVSGATTLDSTLNVSGAATFQSDVGVSGNSIFNGTVLIEDETTIRAVLNVDVGETTLDVNGVGMNLVVDDGFGNTSQLEVTSTRVALTQSGSGFTSEVGNTSVIGANTATITGGGTSMDLTNTGVNFSGPGGAPVRLSGVADGIAPTDAVNVRQLGALESQMSAGIAGTMAMSQLPTIMSDQNYSFGLALGTFNGESALAVGGTARFENNMTVRGALQNSTAGGLGVAVGIGWSWP
jgi:hypothetical protein